MFFNFAEPLNATKNVTMTPKVVVLRKVTYFLVGCIQFIDMIALECLPVSTCCSERSAYEKKGTIGCNSIQDKKWNRFSKGECKSPEFAPNFSDKATSLLVQLKGLRASFEQKIPLASRGTS